MRHKAKWATNDLIAMSERERGEHRRAGGGRRRGRMSVSVREGAMTRR